MVLDHQLSIWEILGDEKNEKNEKEAWITRGLQGGSGFENGRVRIFAAVMHMKNTRELIDFLKEEYGTGGCSHEGGFIDYTPAKGITFRKWKSNEETVLTWKQAADRIMELIKRNNYLTQKDMARIDAIRADNGGILPPPRARMHYE